MKKISLLFVAVLFFSYSCSLLEDANTVELDSSISMDIPVAVSNTSAIDLKSVANYQFSESGSASLSDDSDLQKYLEKIKSIDIENVTVTFYGIQAGQVIETVTLSVAGVGTVATINNVSSSNTVHNPEISSSMLEQVAKKLEDSWSISATVAGNTNNAPMYFSIFTEYDLVVKAEAL